VVTGLLAEFELKDIKPEGARRFVLPLVHRGKSSPRLGLGRFGQGELRVLRDGSERGDHLARRLVASIDTNRPSRCEHAGELVDQIGGGLFAGVGRAVRVTEFFEEADERENVLFSGKQFGVELVGAHDNAMWTSSRSYRYFGSLADIVGLSGLSPLYPESR